MDFQNVKTSSLDPEGQLEVIELLVRGAKELLGSLYIGTYLQGSQATGGFDEYSDLDFMIAVKAEPSADAIDRLQNFHRSLYKHASHWGRHLEGSYISRESLRTFPPPRRELLYLDHGHTQFQMSDHDHFLAVLWILREKGVVLDGPEPKSLIPPISSDALREETKSTMDWWADQICGDPTEMTQKWSQALAVLSFCRMMATFCEGEVRSKHYGVEWAKREFAAQWHNLIDEAVGQRRSPMEELLAPAEPEVVDRTKAFIRYVLKQHSRFENID